MRIFPIVTALVVSVALYLFVFERERLLGFASASEGPTETLAVAEDEPAETGVPVVAMRSKAMAIDQAVFVRGRTEAARQVDVRAQTAGLVISTPLRKGATIAENELMCELDPGTRKISLQDAQARLLESQARLPEAIARQAEAEARLSEALINDNAASRLSVDGFASETRVAQTNAAVESARAGVESAKSGVQAAMAGVQSSEAGVAAAEDEISKLRLYAPFSGLLESDTAELGSLLQPGALCGTIIQLSPIKMVGFVPETEVDRVTVGTRAAARLASGREVVGEVTFLSRSADPTTRTFRVEVEVDNTDQSIRDGQTAEIIIASDGTTAHLVPQSALTLNDDGDLGLRVVTAEQQAAFVPVSVLRDTVDGVWLSGLQDEVAIIIVGQEFVTDGVPVQTTYKEMSQ